MNPGVLLDGPVEGVAYATESNLGFTDSEGQFYYSDGDTVQFSIGDIHFPLIDAQAEVTPFTLAGVADTENLVSVNIARFLQALDEDGDHDNGIQVGNTAHNMATDLSVDFASPSFDSDVANYIANAGGSTGVLPSDFEALTNVAETLGADPGCGSDHSMVGQVANLSTKAYQVQGQVTVINNCSLLFTHFSYTGGGLPDVFFYTGPDGSFSSGTGFGDNLYAQQFTDENFVMPVSANILDELDAISVWCVQAGVSFGDGEFSPVY